MTDLNDYAATQEEIVAYGTGDNTILQDIVTLKKCVNDLLARVATLESQLNT